MALNGTQQDALARLERQGTLSPHDQGQLLALRMSGELTERDRIDRLLSERQETVTGREATQAGYLEHLAESRSTGVCPTCGQKWGAR